MKFRNLSARNIVLRDSPGTIYVIPAYGEQDINSSLWADIEFRRSMRLRIRDIVVSDDVATALPTVINAANAASTPLVLAGAAGQTGDLQQWKNSVGTVLAKINNIGEITVPKINLTASSPSTEPITITALSGQTAALQSWRDQANAALVQITAAGRVQLGADVELWRSSTNVLTTSDRLLIQSNEVPAFSVRATADTQDKISIRPDSGGIWWGSGSGAVDTVLSRAAAGVLETAGSFRSGDGIIVSQNTASPTTAILGIRFGSGLDTNIYRSAADTLRTDDSFVVGTNLTVTGTTTLTGIPTGPTAAPGTNTTQLATTAFVTEAVSAISGGSGGIAFLGNTQTFTAVNTFEAALATTVAIQARVAADTTPRFAALAGGTLEWGPGNAARDTNLYRSAANRLKTDDEFEVGAQLRLTALGLRFNDGTTLTTAPTLSSHGSTHHPQTGTDRFAMSLSTAIASRPAATAVVDGTMHYASDEGILYRSNATSWSKIATKDYADLDGLPPTDGSAATASLRTLGTGSTQAAAGNDNRFTPPGVVVPYAGASAPTGWLLCDGSAVSRTTYAALFSAIGTQYGVGDGSTTFNLPDIRGRVPVGLGPHADVDTLGENDGTTSTSRTPRHKTSVTTNPTYSGNTSSSGDHSHGGFEAPSSTPGTGGTGLAGGDRGAVTTTTANGNHSHSFSGSVTGGQYGPQTNTPTDTPAYIVLNYIIRT